VSRAAAGRVAAVTGPLSLTLPPALAEHLLVALPGLADDVLAAIAREVPAYARPFEGAFGAGVRRGVQLALSRFLALAGHPAADDDGELAARGRELYAELGRGEARVGRSLDALLAAYRTGARVAWARLAELGLAVGLTAHELVELAGAVFAYIDELSAASAEGFTAEQAALAGDRERRRRTLAALLLSDAPTWQVEEAASVAGWLPPPSLTAVLVPPTTGRELAARWDERALVASDDEALGELLLLPDVEGPGRLDRLLRLLGGRPSVIGLPRAWNEVRQSAALVRRTAAAGAPSAPELVADHLADLVVAAEPLALAELAVRRLAPFGELTPKGRERLLETLRSWLAHQGDRSSVAAELGIHPQTVRYRVGQLRELLGEDLQDPARRFELALVLHQKGAAARPAAPGQPGPASQAERRPA